MSTLSEDYGHVIAESLTVGTQVIISDQTPWNDVEDNNAGFVCELNDNDRFVKSIISVINSEQDKSDCVKTNIMKKIRLNETRKQYEIVLSRER